MKSLVALVDIVQCCSTKKRKQEGKLPLTDCGSAFMSHKNFWTERGRSLKIFLSSSWITMQNLVAVPRTICTYAGTEKILEMWAPPLRMGVVDPL